MAEEKLEKLQTLGKLFYLLAGLGLVFVVMLATFFVIGALEDHGISLWIELALILAAFLCSLLLLLTIAYTGEAVRKQHWWSSCFGMSVIICFALPLGTALGVYSLLTLKDPEVKALFAAESKDQGPIDGTPFDIFGLLSKMWRELRNRKALR